MTRTLKRISAAIAAVLVVALAAVSQTPKGHKHKVVIEMSVGSPVEWSRLIAHIGALRSVFANDVDIEVVALGEGIAILEKTDTNLQAPLESAAENGVVFAACQNSMRARNIKTEDLFPFATEVPAGIAEVVMKQEAGYSYLKVAPE